MMEDDYMIDSCNKHCKVILDVILLFYLVALHKETEIPITEAFWDQFSTEALNRVRSSIFIFSLLD